MALGVAILMHAINNIANGVPFWHGMGKTMVMSAITGGITAGIGAAANAAFSAATTVGKALFQAGLHGIVGGIMSSIEGGSFESGFAAGAISSLVSSGISTLGETTQTANGISKTVANNFGKSGWFKATMIASAGLSGGLSSSIAGGSFWAGARQGVIVATMNHLAHMGFDKSGENDNNTSDSKKEESTTNTQQRQPWDLNGDGKLQKVEADLWGVKQQAKAIYVDNKNIDWAGLKIPEGLKKGDTFSVETHNAFLDLPYETASTYGGTSFIVTGKDTVTVVNQKYHYDMRNNNSSLKDIVRDFATQVGYPSVMEMYNHKFVPYDIIYINPTIKIK